MLAYQKTYALHNSKVSVSALKRIVKLNAQSWLKKLVHFGSLGAVWFYLERLSWIVIVVGGPTFLVEWYHDRGERARQLERDRAEHYLQLQRDKASETLSFVKTYQDATLVAQRFALLEPWLSEQNNLSFYGQMDGTYADFEDLVLKTVAARPQLRTAIFGVVDFYETLQLCIDADRCDKKIAISYFQDYSRQFFCFYRPYIQMLKEKQNIQSYGDRLMRFATESGPC